MTAHVSADQVERYLARVLPPAELIAMQDHVGNCADCREALAEAAAAPFSAATPLLATDSDPHLLEGEMVAFVAQRMPEPRRAAVAAHLAWCELCRDSVAAMESVRSQVHPRRVASIESRRRPMPAWVSTAGSAAAILLISLLIYFRAGEVRRVPPVAVVASLKDAGGTIELSADGTLRGLSGLSVAEEILVRDSLRQGALPLGPRIAARASGRLRAVPGDSPKADFALIGPVDIKVLSDRPEFSWEASRNVLAYDVVVTNEHLEPVAHSEKTKATSWQPAAPLPRGVALLWHVRAWHGDSTLAVPAPPHPPARFEIAGQEVANRIEELRASDHPSHLLIAAICMHQGLRDEASKEIQTLGGENPGSALIDNLKSSLH
ncbi:MAG TPA: hypothetical protein VK789_02265 [Bryobacteraceae bacterium]|jgi:hypothetical protein|nr:hypothetical protein [Bryobacteraceae bacterium]